ncbi:MAG: bifunctional phosphopantothenoylcysteine decarboxylase/phosphopantothenate--cysteine ligase CoaBC [Dehalococcoidia bacterium]
MFDTPSGAAELHVELARRADILVVAPAAATSLARLALGLAEEMVSLTALATRAPIVVCPAMDSQMFEHAATQANLETLRARGVDIVGPEEGRLASGQMGRGRLSEVETILGAVRQALGRDGDLAGKKVVVSAGGTREPIDPVRFISNHSSGKMGFALAEAARDRGADVSLVSTVTTMPCPYGVALAPVETVAQMREAVLAACREADALIMAAAVSDYRPAERAEQKVKKGPERWALDLVKNPDFLLEVPDGLVKVGFAAESEELLANARQKLQAKRLDLIAANNIAAEGSGFGTDTNKVTLLSPDGDEEDLPLMSKYDVAGRILDRVVQMLEGKARR